VYILKLDARQKFGFAAGAADPFESVGNEFHNPVVVKLGSNKVERQDRIPLPRYGILRVNFRRIAIPDELDKGFNPDLDLCQAEAEARAQLWREQGYIDLFGRHYVLLDQSSNGVKVAEAEFILDGYRDAYLDWWHCGMKLLGLDLHTQVEKDARATTTCLPHCYYFGEDGSIEYLQGLIPEMIIDDMVIMPKVVTGNHQALEGKTRLFNMTDKPVEGVEPGQVGISSEAWEETDSDGGIWYVLDDTKEDENSRKIKTMAKQGKFISYTINAAGEKGCVNIILKSTLISFLEEEIKDGYIKEYKRDEAGNLIAAYTENAWHEKVNFLGKPLFGTPDTFKWFKSQDFKIPEGWSQFIEGFNSYGHTFDVSVVPHVVWRHMPYQMTLGLIQSKEDADWMINREVSNLNSYKIPEEAAKLLPKWMREALKVYPELWQDKFFRFCAQAAYTKKRWAAMAGKLDRMGKYFFLAPDTVGIFRAWCGDNRPYIQAGNIIQPGCEEGKRVVMARNPFPGINFCLRTRQKIDEKYYGFYTSNTVYVSMLDDSMVRMQADFDGDKVFIIEDEEVYAMAEKALKATGYLTVRWAKPDGHKQPYSDEVFWNHVLEANTSEVGIICSGIVKVRAVDAQQNKDWETSTAYDLEKNAIGEAACTLDIDAAKGTGAKVQAWYAIAEGKAYKYAKRPLHMAYQKSSPAPNTDEAVEKKCREFEKSNYYGHHLLDYATQMIGVLTDETLYVDAHSSEEFRYLKLTSDPKHTKGKAGLADLLSEAIKEFRTEYARLCAATDNSMATSEFTKRYYENLRVKILARGFNAGMTQEETVDALIKTVYNGYKDIDIAAHEKEFRILWTCFGEELVANLKANQGIKNEDIDNPEDAYCPDESEEDFAVLDEDMCFADEGDGFFMDE